MRTYHHFVIAVTALFAAAVWCYAAAAEAGTPRIREYVIAQPAGGYCEFSVALPQDAAGSSRDRLLTFMEVAAKRTKNWTTGFAVTQADYLTNNSFHLIEHETCSRKSGAVAFVQQFFEDWHRQHCADQCKSTAPQTVSLKGLPSAMPRRSFTYASQIDEFLSLRDGNSLQECILQIDLPNEVAPRFAQTKLFGALVGLENVYRFPILDISQIDDKVYILFSRQCTRKKALFDAMRESLARSDVDDSAFKLVNFHPDISEYYYSETGKKLRT